MDSKVSIYILLCFVFATLVEGFKPQPKINVEGAIERFLNALGEYYDAGGISSVTRSMIINEGTVLVPRVRVFGQEEAQNSPYPVTCFRIPAVVQTDSGIILAFAEARLNTCADCAELGIAMRRSEDGGQTWGEVTWPVPPTFSGPGTYMTRGGNPTVVYDSKRKQVVLHFNRGMTDLDGDGNYDCIPAVDNFQIVSKDDGLTWGQVRNISEFLQEHRGLLSGPGTGAYIPEVDRIIFAGHYQTAERNDGRVVMYYSDDGGNFLKRYSNPNLKVPFLKPNLLLKGETYQISSSTFPRADEASVAHIGGQNLTVNLRRDVNECDICPPKANGCNCRGRSFSQDNGLTWSNMELDPQLHDPICEGSIVQIGPYTAFSNPPMSYARANMSIALSTDGGRTWDYRLKVTDEYQYTDYSSLVNGELIRGEASTNPMAGLLWGSCLHPIPMRVWCLWPTSWEIYFSRIELNPDNFVPA